MSQQDGPSPVPQQEAVPQRDAVSQQNADCQPHGPTEKEAEFTHRSTGDNTPGRGPLCFYHGNKLTLSMQFG